MTLRSNRGPSQVHVLSIAGGATLDIANNPFIIDYTGASPIADVRALILQGYNNGTWTGTGISSSAAAADSRVAIGYGEASQVLGPSGGTFAGVNVEKTPEQTPSSSPMTLRGSRAIQSASMLAG